MGKCKTKYCRNEANHGSVCNSCNCRKTRAKNPIRYAFDVLKMNAKRRGKVFTITFEYFKKFAIETNYIAGKGRKKLSYSVDRINNKLGYVPGNLQVLTKTDNSKKGIRSFILTYDWKSKVASIYKSPIRYKTA